jgi:hypothetical protein
MRPGLVVLNDDVRGFGSTAECMADQEHGGGTIPQTSPRNHHLACSSASNAHGSPAQYSLQSHHHRLTGTP